ncbi:MAG: N-acetylmuramoyl-L-alanine amidase [Clostridia bacterium]|nr:N-acetylmuramoyl-L-alanine amidase [Clostridia bacterium]
MKQIIDFILTLYEKILGRLKETRLRHTWSFIKDKLKKLPVPLRWQFYTITLILVIGIFSGISNYLNKQPNKQPIVPPPAKKEMQVPLKQEEKNLLARLVAAEAQNEPYVGQVAVVAVVLNRLESPAFPNTIPEIVFEPWAFESVANGFIWQVPIKSSYYTAVQDALSGWDPSNGALYFFNPEKATSAWIWTRPQITKIGNHIFTY